MFISLDIQEKNVFHSNAVQISQHIHAVHFRDSCIYKQQYDLTIFSYFHSTLLGNEPKTTLTTFHSFELTRELMRG